DRVDEQGADGSGAAEAHLGLRRVHVDVHLARIEIDENGEQRLPAARHEVRIGRTNSADEQLVAYGPAVDEQELLARVRPVQGGQAGKARYANAFLLACDLERIVDEGAAHHLPEPLQKTLRARIRS